MALYFSKKVRYIPKFGGQRDAENPVVFILEPLGSMEIRELIARQGPDASGTVMLGLLGELLPRKILAIEHLEADDGPIKTGAQFCESVAIPLPLWQEIALALMEISQITENEVKNSDSPPLPK